MKSPFSEWFLSLSALNLSIYFLIILLNDENPKTKFIIPIIFVFLIGMIAEIIGVNYGYIFGDYVYGENLGIKIFGVPLIIGLNWVTLSYISASISSKVSDTYALKIIIASLLMVLLDLPIEISAPRFDFWEFEGGIAPFQNYIGWFFTAILAQAGFQYWVKNYNIKIAYHIYIAIFIFFLTFVFI